MLRVAKKKSSKQNKQYKIKKKQVATTEFLLKKTEMGFSCHNCYLNASNIHTSDELTKQTQIFFTQKVCTFLF